MIKMLTNKINEILEEYDFTDSIITDMRWENSLLDYSITIDYNFYLPENEMKTKDLKLIFQNCTTLNLNLARNLFDHIEPNQTNFYSWFTIVKFNFREQDKDYIIELYTYEFDTPSISITCNSIELHRY
ncbi:hypothetical protein ACTSEZ_09295 [Metabacillus sp. JX24]|uniref:hypothetical protein n=1 Tax=Metabacillus sp. JX24 TaxID=3240759 RepID=UPI00350EAEE5